MQEKYAGSWGRVGFLAHAHLTVCMVLTEGAGEREEAGSSEDTPVLDEDIAGRRRDTLSLTVPEIRMSTKTT